MVPCIYLIAIWILASNQKICIDKQLVGGGIQSRGFIRIGFVHPLVYQPLIVYIWVRITVRPSVILDWA